MAWPYKKAMIQKIKGTMDLLPEQTPLYRHMEQVMREEAEKYGFGEIRTPMFENTELFVRGVGDTTDVVQKEMYTFVDKDEGRSITLRPEGTASVARAVIARPAVNICLLLGKQGQNPPRKPGLGRGRNVLQCPGVQRAGFRDSLPHQHLPHIQRMYRVPQISQSRRGGEGGGIFTFFHPYSFPGISSNTV